LVTTDQDLSASWSVRHSEERPEIAQDDKQMKSGGRQLQKLSSTRYGEGPETGEGPRRLREVLLGLAQVAAQHAHSSC
jgi:hypothetical protein